LDGFEDSKEVRALRESLMMAIISAVKMLASVGNLYSFFTDPEMNAQPVPVIFFDAFV